MEIKEHEITIDETGRVIINNPTLAEAMKAKPMAMRTADAGPLNVSCPNTSCPNSPCAE